MRSLTASVSLPCLSVGIGSQRILSLSLSVSTLMLYEGRSVNSGTARFLVNKVKDKNCSMWCSCDIYSVLHIPWVFITTSFMTTLFFRILIGSIGLQQEHQIVIKYLVAEGVSSADLYHRLAVVFKDD